MGAEEGRMIVSGVMLSGSHSISRALIATSSGGRGGGGALVTKAGLDALKRYRSMETKAGQAVEKEISDFADLLKTAKSS